MFKMKVHDLYYSKKQEQSCKELTKLTGKAYYTPHATGINGEDIVYTECVEEGKKPISKWDDFNFVGKAEMIG